MKKLSITKMADTIIAKRKEQKLTQAQLAKMTGINRGMHDAILFFAVCVKHWHLVCFSFFDHSVKRLDDHFADTLAGSHDVCWVYRFVCTDQYESLAAVDHGCVSCFICSDGIILDCLVR